MKQLTSNECHGFVEIETSWDPKQTKTLVAVAAAFEKESTLGFPQRCVILARSTTLNATASHWKKSY